VARFDTVRFRWRGVTPIPYKAAANGTLAWQGVQRFVLAGRPGDATAFQLRYFEIAPGGYSSLELHAHAHAVMVVRGRGQILAGRRVVQVRPLDFVFIPPGVPHQFQAGRERFGFLCPVDATRDRPRPVAAAQARRLPARRPAGRMKRVSGTITRETRSQLRRGT
jgi:quercetin dioxygenase-like cupin family protein